MLSYTQFELTKKRKVNENFAVGYFDYISDWAVGRYGRIQDDFLTFTSALVGLIRQIPLLPDSVVPSGNGC